MTYIPARQREKVIRRSGGRCECTMLTCGHGLLGCFRNATQMHHRNRQLKPPALNYVNNLLHMCDECHQTTRTFGKPR